MVSPSFSPSRHLWQWGLLLAVLGSGVFIYTQTNKEIKTQTDQLPATSKTQFPVTALGYLEPEGEIVRLAAPASLDGDRLKELRFQLGDHVKAGEVIAVLDASDRLADEVSQAKSNVEIAKAALAQVKAGAKTAEIQAQEAAIARWQAELNSGEAAQAATIARWEAEVRNAQTELARFESLYTEGAISASTLDSKRLATETARAQLQESLSSRDRLVNTLQAQIAEAISIRDRIAEVRPVDIAIKEQELEGALIALQRAETNLAQAYIRAPKDSQILKITTRVGEKINDNGIVELGQTHQMIAVLEIYQTDIDRINTGQPVEITGQSFEGTVQGIVSQIGLQVEKQRTTSNQPGENLDRRVIPIKVRLNPEDSHRVASFSNLQIQGKILVSPTQSTP